MDVTILVIFGVGLICILAITLIALIAHEKDHLPSGQGQGRLERRWSRVEVIGLLTLGLMVVGTIGTYLTIPEFHDWVKNSFGRSTEGIKVTETDPVDPALKTEGSNQGNRVPPGKKKALYHYSRELKEGETFLDPYTGAALGISQIYGSNHAVGSVSLPGKETQNFDYVQPGTAWRFNQSGATFSLIITKINHSDNSFHVDIKEERK